MKRADNVARDHTGAVHSLGAVGYAGGLAEAEAEASGRLNRRLFCSSPCSSSPYVNGDVSRCDGSVPTCGPVGVAAGTDRGSGFRRDVII